MKGAAPFILANIPLVGRTTELTTLKNAWEETKGGKAQFLMIAGESGVGKTRLASELAQQIKGEGEILVGRSSEVGMTLPYRIFTEPLQEYFKKALETHVDIKSLVGPRPAEVVDFIPEIARAGIDLEAAVKISGAGAKYRLFEELTQIFVNISKNKPLLLILDDLQWTRALSREFLDYFVRTIAQEKIFICATWRQEGTAGPPQFERAVIIDLSGFDYHEIKNFLTVSLGTPDIPQGFAQSIYRQSGGNPFYIEEIIKSLIESEALKFDNGWRFPDLAVQAIPATITEVVKNRLEKLDPDTREILSQAAFIGQQFSFDILLPITGRDADYLERVLEQAIVSLIVRQEPSILEMRYGFVHDLIRTVFYESIATTRRPQLHQKIAETLETMYRYRVDDILSDLAFHYSHTPNRVKAAEYLKRAGDYASDHFANEEAIKFYTMALESTSDKREIAEKLGRVHMRIAKSDEAIHAFEIALQYAIAPDDKAKIFCDLGKTYEKAGRYSDAIIALEQGLTILADRPSAHKPRLFNDWAWICFRKGNYEQARSFCLKALSLPEIGDLEKTSIYDLLANTHIATGEIPLALQYFRQALDISERIGDIVGVSAIYNNLTNIYIIRGEFSTALQYLMKTLETTEKIGDPFRNAALYINIGETYTILNDFDQALGYLNRALVISERINNPLGSGWVYGCLGRLYQSRGDLKTAREYYSKAIGIFGRLGNKNEEYGTRSCLADLCLEEEKLPEAEELIAQVTSYAESSNMVPLKGPAYLSKAKLCLRDPVKWDEAKTCIEKSIALCMDDKNLLISAYEQLARLSLLRQKNSEAAAAIKKAEDIIRSIVDNLPEGAMRNNFMQRRDIQGIQQLGQELQPLTTG